MNGNRKLIVVLTALLGGIALTAFGKMTGNDFGSLAMVCVGAFAGANIFEHKYSAAKTQAAAQPEPAA